MVLSPTQALMFCTHTWLPRPVPATSEHASQRASQLLEIRQGVLLEVGRGNDGTTLFTLHHKPAPFALFLGEAQAKGDDGSTDRGTDEDGHHIRVHEGMLVQDAEIGASKFYDGFVDAKNVANAHVAIVVAHDAGHGDRFGVAFDCLVQLERDALDGCCWRHIGKRFG